MKKLSQEVRDLIIEGSKWSSVGITPTAKEAIDETTEEEVIEEEEEEAEESEEEVIEEESVSRCPLCVSELETPLDEDTLLEHLDVVLALVDRISESEEGEEIDMEALINEVFDSLDEEAEEDEEEEETEE